VFRDNSMIFNMYPSKPSVGAQRALVALRRKNGHNFRLAAWAGLGMRDPDRICGPAGPGASPRALDPAEGPGA